MTTDEIVRVAMNVPGFIQPHELRWLAAQAQTRHVILELGSWKGKSTKALALACPGTVYAVDHWQGSGSELQTTHAEVASLGADGLFEIFKANLGDEIRSGKVLPFRAESGVAADLLRNEKNPRWIDMVFIDGDHMYESVKRDIQLWMPFVAPGGLLCGHDYYDAPGVRQAVNELVPWHTAGPIWSCVMP